MRVPFWFPLLRIQLRNRRGTVTPLVDSLNIRVLVEQPSQPYPLPGCTYDNLLAPEHFAYFDEWALFSLMGLLLRLDESTSGSLESNNIMTTNARADPNEHYPSAADASNSITQHGFKISTRKLPILKAEPIEQMTADLGIAPPEMIFGDNLVSIEHVSGWGINFNAYDALDRVDKTGGSMLQVAHSKEWQSTRYAGLEIAWSSAAC